MGKHRRSWLLVALAATATAAADEPPRAATNSIGMALVPIPAGEFVMGNRDSAEALARAFPAYEAARIADLGDESPAHEVRITRPFEMGKCEVTVGQFRKFAEDSGYKTDAERDGAGGHGYDAGTGKFAGRSPKYTWRDPGFRQGDDHPVVNVSWYDAVAFCDWLGKKEGRAYRLPTEAEWEYACRAGTATRFHSGDDPEALTGVAAVYDTDTRKLFPEWSRYALESSDGVAFTAPVGSLGANRFGLHDMHGNAWEWCADWYAADYYARSPAADPRGPADGEVRVRRGGSWHTWALYARSSYRNYNAGRSRYLLLGFRVAREPAP